MGVHLHKENGGTFLTAEADRPLLRKNANATFTTEK